MTRLAILLGATIAAGAAMPAQAYEWGGGSCIGYGCVRAVHEGEYVPASRVYGVERPRLRAYEYDRRVYRVPPADDWDDEDDD